MEEAGFATWEILHKNFSKSRFNVRIKEHLFRATRKRRKLIPFCLRSEPKLCICPGIAPRRSHAWLVNFFPRRSRFFSSNHVARIPSARTDLSHGITRSHIFHPSAANKITWLRDWRTTGSWQLKYTQWQRDQLHLCPARPCQQIDLADQQSASTGTY